MNKEFVTRDEAPEPGQDQALSSVSREINKQSCLNQCRFVFFVIFTAMVVSSYFLLVLFISRSQFENRSAALDLIENSYLRGNLLSRLSFTYLENV